MNAPLSFCRPSGLRTSVTAVALALACLAPSAQAMRIGAAEVRSSLGQTLDLVVPISADGDPSFQTECARVLRDASNDGIPGPGATQWVVEPRGADYVLRIRTAHPIFEPAIKLVLEIGCAQRLRREFVLLIDPPIARDGGAARTLAGAPIELPLVLGESVVTSGRGEPLRMRVPVGGRDAPELDAACVAVTTNPGGAATSLLRRSGNATTLLISTAAPVEQARIGVSVQAGCSQPVVRDYNLLLAAPELAQASGDGSLAAPPPAAAKPRKPAKPRAQPATASAAAPRASTTTATEPSATSAKSVAAEARPARPAGGDRLVLAEPEAPVASRPDAAPVDKQGLNEREQAINAQLETLAKEMAQLRTELAAAQARNLELMKLQQAAAAPPPSAPSYAWIFAALAASALGLGLLLAWRSRKPLESGGWADDQSPAVGPATRLGVAHATVPLAQASVAAPASAPAPMAAVAEPAAPVRRQRETETHDDEGHAIHVTEFANTGQLIENLYSDYLAAPSPARAKPPVVPAPGPVETVVPVDIDLGGSSELAPLTKTQLAVDLDVGTQALPTQVLDDWDQELFEPPKAKAVGDAAIGTLTPLDFELKFDLPSPPPASTPAPKA